MDVVKEKLEVVEWKVEDGLFPIIYSSLFLRGVKCSDHFCCLFVVRWMAYAVQKGTPNSIVVYHFHIQS